MKRNKLVYALALSLAAAGTGAAALAADLQITLYRLTAQGVGESLGTIGFRDSSDFGLLIIPLLQGLEPGAHGFHVVHVALVDQHVDEPPAAARLELPRLLEALRGEPRGAQQHLAELEGADLRGAAHGDSGRNGSPSSVSSP